MALEVTRGLSGVFLVTPSVLVSIAVMGISEGNMKCRGSIVWGLENQHQGLSSNYNVTRMQLVNSNGFSEGGALLMGLYAWILLKGVPGALLGSLGFILLCQ